MDGAALIRENTATSSCPAQFRVAKDSCIAHELTNDRPSNSAIEGFRYVEY